ncbi:MAG: hypothetical protein GY804_11875 [Alphaproteobacteria bacterium]|nr:hypothetical protein [Alphaproteobacteria bacterium]
MMEELIAFITMTCGPMLAGKGTKMLENAKDNVEKTVIAGAKKKVEKLFARIGSFVVGDSLASTVVESYKENPDDEQSQDRLKLELNSLFKKQIKSQKEIEEIAKGIKADLESISGMAITYGNQTMGNVSDGSTGIQIQGIGNSIIIPQKETD